jgi:hypothetical protein
LRRFDYKVLRARKGKTGAISSTVHLAFPERGRLVASELVKANKRPDLDRLRFADADPDRDARFATGGETAR